MRQSFGLTQRQFELLAFIRSYQRDNGISPSFEEMCVHMGLRSKSGIARLIAGLEERGSIKRQRRIVKALPRAIRVLEAA